MNKPGIIFFAFLATLVTYLVSDHVFFWDTIQLGSKHAHFYFKNNFTSLILPEEIDSGHPPVFGMYLALLWKVFGRELWVSHFAILPFLLGIIYLIFRLARELGVSQWAIFFALLLLADPVLAGQAVLVSPDICLVFFFLLGLYAIFTDKFGWKMVAVIGLGLISMRGMMTGLMLYVFELYWHWLRREPLSIKLIISRVLPYLPGGILALSFLFYHYQQTGWIGYHANSPWGPSFEQVGWKGVAKNIAVLGWRMLDFGRIGLWLVTIALLIKNFRSIKSRKPENLLVWAFGGLFLILLLPGLYSFLFYKGLQGHRYLLPTFMAFSFFTYFLILTYVKSRKAKIIVLSFCVISFIGGNFLVYPDKVSQGWDSTLAHLPYYQLRENMIRYIEKRGISYENVGTAFPEIGPFNYKDLSNSTAGFVEKDLETQRFILYSNVMNDFTDAELDDLRLHWKVEKEFKSGGLRVVLYSRSGDG